MARHVAPWAPTQVQRTYEFYARTYGPGFEWRHFNLVRRHRRQEW